MQEQHELYEYARSRTKQKKRLYLHFIVFVVGSIFLFILDRYLKVGNEFMQDWFVWAIVLWSFFFLWPTYLNTYLNISSAANILTDSYCEAADKRKSSEYCFRIYPINTNQSC